MKKKGGGEKFDSLNNFIIELYYLALGDIAKAQHTAKSFQQGKKFGEDEGAHGLTVSPFPFSAILTSVVMGRCPRRIHRMAKIGSVGDGTDSKPECRVLRLHFSHMMLAWAQTRRHSSSLAGEG